MAAVQGGNQADNVIVYQTGDNNASTVNQDVSGVNTTIDTVVVTQTGHGNSANVTQQ